MIGSWARYQYLQDIGISPPVFSRLFVSKLFVYRTIIAANLTSALLMGYQTGKQCSDNCAWFYPRDFETASYTPFLAIAVEITQAACLLWAQHLLKREYTALLSEAWYCHKLLILVSFAALSIQLVFFYEEFTTVMLIVRLALITLWLTLQIMQLKTKKRTMDAPRVLPMFKRNLSSESSYSDTKNSNERRAYAARQVQSHRSGQESLLKSQTIREPLLRQQLVLSESKQPSGAYINIKINSIKTAENDHILNFTTIVKNLSNSRVQNGLLPVQESFMDEFTDETFKQGKFTPDRHNEAETKISFWQKLNLFNKSQHQQTSHNRSNSGSEQSITFSPKTQKHDRERLFEQLIFPGVERSAVLSEYWMQNLGPGYENIQELIRQKDTKKIQIKLNDLAAIKNIWVDESLAIWATVWQ